MRGDMSTLHRHSSRTARGHRTPRQGLALLEIVVATLFLVIVVAGMSRGLASSTALERVTREQGVAREAVRGKLEELRATAFREVLARYDQDPGNDLPGACPGALFDVEGLNPRRGDPDGRVGEIVFPVSAGELREDLELARLGMPRDLNGDQELDGIDHSGDYLLLPVLVRVEWQGVSRCSLELALVLKRMDREAEEP